MNSYQLFKYHLYLSDMEIQKWYEKDHVPCCPSIEWQKLNIRILNLCLYLYIGILWHIYLYEIQLLPKTKRPDLRYTKCYTLHIFSPAHLYTALKYMSLSARGYIFLLWLVAVFDLNLPVCKRKITDVYALDFCK